MPMTFAKSGRRAFPWLILVSFAASAAALASACSGTSTQPTPGDTCTSDLGSIQETVFARSCSQQGCHSSVEPAAFLDLASPGVEQRLVGAPSATCENKVLVAPGNPDQSFLIEKMRLAMPGCGLRMPPTGALPAEEIACIESWIAGLPEGSAPDGGTDAPSCEMCGGASCVDLATDPTNCGACGKVCPPGATCAGGACACSGALTACGDACVDTSVDLANCGGCDKPCPQGSLCEAGQCACPGGLEACNGPCVDTSSDPMNCGTCGNACGAGKVCNGGACLANCGMLETCGASCVDTSTSVTNCGACGNTCAAGASCALGMCTCPAATSACNGACINTTTDPANCGACGKVCAAGTTCLDGACVCPGGGVSCGGTCVDTQTDPNNCGACGNACAAGQACAGGTCTCGSGSVSFAADVQPIFTTNCASAGCHKGINAQEGLDLSAGKAYAKLVNVAAAQCSDGRKLVLPGDPAQSYLIDKMMNVDICAGTKMPKLGMLPSAQITTVANWICAGAPNN